MTDCLLIDTDVLIDYLRNRQEAVAYLESATEPLLISVVTIAELYAGVQEGSERTKLDVFITAFEIASLDLAIAIVGGLHRRQYHKSHNVSLADALIAATAEHHQAKFVTLNSKHFPMIKDVIVPYVKA
ncbi:Ribonuclease VapC10 [Thermoflexales bacterium]|nr:Ribonuclease VapC10 [Thermoflexales bacterium]